jgi:hypothetical protein
LKEINFRMVKTNRTYQAGQGSPIARNFIHISNRPTPRKLPRTLAESS